jgi:ankyrin repeat protein
MPVRSESRPYPSPVPTDLSPPDEVVEFACLTFHPDDSRLRRRRAERLALARPALASEGFLAAVVLGDVEAVRRGLALDPGLATRPGGPRGWVPLLYLGFGRLSGARGCDAIEVARLLLAAGADPGSFVRFHDRYLIERSTDVFAVTYAADAHRLLELLEADPSRANARRPEDGRSPLHVLAGLDIPGCEPLVDLLVQHGADLQARNAKGQTPLDLAIEARADDTVASLVRLGAREGSA